MTTGAFAWGRWVLGVVLASTSVVACGGSDDGNDEGHAGENGAGATGGGSSATGGTDGATGGSDASGGTEGSTGGTGGTGGSSATGGSSSGTGGSTSGKGGSSSQPSGNTEELLDQIEDECEKDCDAQYALECAPANGNTLTCQLSCAAQTAQLGDFCLAEYRDYVACRAEGGYECVQTTPYPQATCAGEQLAFSQCAQHIGCKRYCAKTIEQSCTTADLDTCVESCIAEAADLPERCSYYGETLHYCQATSTAECAGEGLTTPAACASTVLHIAECVSDEAEDLCAGWCWAADRLGCGGDDCAADCADKQADETCGAAWTDLIDCGLFFGDAGCDVEDFNANGICDSEVSTYRTCVEGGSEEP